MNQILISGIIGLLTGALGSLVAPWINWGIEKRKIQRKERVKLLKDLRKYSLTDSLQNKNFLNSNMYIQIRPFLSDNLIEELEMDGILIEVSNRNPLPKLNSIFLIELAKIERSWGLSIGKGQNYTKPLYNPKKGGITATFSVGTPNLNPKSK